jgi:hypothetical protein
MNVVVNENLRESYQEWLHHDDALPFFDVKHLLQLERINKTWQKLCKNIVVNENLQALHQQWLHQDEGALVMHVLSFLDFKLLMQLERVNKTWRKLCK